MQNTGNTTPDPTDPIKPDLKHDSMEYSAATDGDDTLDTDLETKAELEDESISAEELEYLEADTLEDKAEALNAAETDSQVDEDNFILEPDQEEKFEQDEPDEEAHRRT